jgi:biotin operon repressor
MTGWVSLHRKILEWEWYDDANVCRLFIHCLLKANHQHKKWKGIDIERGQFITSLDKLSKETGLSVSQVRTCMKKLKSTGEIASKSHTQHTVITVLSYDSHQCNDKQNDKPMTNQSQTNDKPIATTNNDNNENNENKSKRFAPPSIEEVFEHLSDSGYPYKIEAEKFWNYYESNGWKVGKNKMKNWKSAATGWIKRTNLPKKQAPQNNMPPADYDPLESLRNM